MSSRPFLTRLIAPFGVVMALIVGICGLEIQLAGERRTRSQQTADLNRLAPLVRQWVPQQPFASVGDADRGRLVDAARLLDTRITLIDGGGRVVFDTLIDATRTDNHNDRPEIVAARQTGSGHSVRTSRTLGEPSVYAAILLDPVKPDGVVLRLSYPQHTWADLGSSAWPLLAGGVAAAVCAVGLLWLALQRQWIDPIRRLAVAADRMAGGDWGQRVRPSGAAEVRAFTARLNLAASHAQKHMADLKHQRSDLQALVDTLPDPVLVTDADRRVSLLNRAAVRLLDLRGVDVPGRGVVDVVGHAAVLELFDRARAADAAAPPLTRELRLNRAGQWYTYQAVAQRTADAGVLLVLRDVTALAATVQMKTDFVGNASHELRTPIAAIKIAFETLRDVYGEDPEQVDRCLAVIEGHIGRLEEMLRDLLDMARVESPTLKPQVRRIRTADVFGDLRASLGTMARQKGVDLRLGDGVAGRADHGSNGSPVGGDGGAGAKAPADFCGDERLLNLSLKNLVENSIKFTPAGGSVTVRVRTAPPGRPPAGRLVTEPSAGVGSPPPSLAVPARPPVFVTVADTGIGIPAEHIDRVFERFYQVDPARSGSAGRGTGLGLAIVKHAIAASGGSVYVDSVVGRGTTVTCVLPQFAEALVDQVSDR